jgi:hypothetical protein
VLFLTDDEVVELTGYRQRRKQVEMLKRQRVPFHLNAAGQPKVARAALEGSRSDRNGSVKGWTPSWADTAR